MEKEIHTNPFTGKEYHRLVDEYGIATNPHQSSKQIKLLDGKIIGGTEIINLSGPNEDYLLLILKDTAKGLSDMTGKKVEFVDIRDNNSAVWGVMGYFAVMDPIKFNGDVGEPGLTHQS